jgi:GntR family transcriptional regulator
LAIFVRIEPSSSVPIYRQIIEQIKYQVVTGVLREGDKIPSVRELATTLAVNQNTILKVYNELCRQNVLRIERGDGTYVSSGRQTIPAAERRQVVANVLREAAVLAIQLELPIEQVSKLLQKEYETIVLQRDGAGKTSEPEN